MIPNQPTLCHFMLFGHAHAVLVGGHILPAMERGVWKRVLFAATGALMSPVTCQQGCSIPGICHAAAFETEER